jgi:PAS domain-containing protein
MEARVPDWAMDMNCAITVCDREGTIVYMNEPSRELYRKHGNLIGKNLIPCHGERSRGIIRDLLATGGSNVYTIEKKGVRKLIYQSAWRENGEVAGLVEFSIILPAEMPHYVRE